MKILAIGTYPIRRPMHGGQRRTAQLGAFYERQGIEYRHACVFVPAHYSGDAISGDDYPYASPGGVYSEVPFIEDLGSGAFAATQDGPYRHFRDLICAFAPDAIQVEQPFMWPLVRRVLDEGVAPGVKLIYSSHNFEAPLKRNLLEVMGVDRRLVSRTEALINDIERELAERADLLFVVSQTDADAYRVLAPKCDPFVVRNGSERPCGITVRPPAGEEMKSGDYLLFVGSAYPPNIQGFEKFVLDRGLYGFPPEKLFAVCGGAASGIYTSRFYAPHSEGYADRVHFFPSPSDEELGWLRDGAKGVIVPIGTGGGSNLKTAEALSSGKWVVTTAKAMRSFEDFIGQPGVLTVSAPAEFQQAMLDVVHGKPLYLTETERYRREGLFWDRLLDDSGLGPLVLALEREKKLVLNCEARS